MTQFATAVQFSSQDLRGDGLERAGYRGREGATDRLHIKPFLGGSLGTAPLAPAQLRQTELPAPGFAPELVQDPHTERRWLVLVHNDEVTPFDYVIRILTNIFLLSEEIADHVAHTAHSEGQAVVVIRPRSEAERLVKIARARARLDGYPLTFSIEPEHG